MTSVSVEKFFREILTIKTGGRNIRPLDNDLVHIALKLSVSTISLMYMIYDLARIRTPSLSF